MTVPLDRTTRNCLGTSRMYDYAGYRRGSRRCFMRGIGSIVCVCVCVCVCGGCLRACVRAYIHTFTPSFLHSFMPSCLHAFMPSCLHAFMPSCLHAFMPSCLHAFMPSFLHSFIPSFLHFFLPSALTSSPKSFPAAAILAKALDGAARNPEP